MKLTIESISFDTRCAIGNTKQTINISLTGCGGRQGDHQAANTDTLDLTEVATTDSASVSILTGNLLTLIIVWK